MNEVRRWAVEAVEQALRVRRVVIVSGARQCGKTTLCRQVMPKDAVYRSLDNKSLRDVARESPADFVAIDNGMMVIDEVQKAPELVSEIKAAVDRDTRPGRYLLTGSSDVRSAPEVNESLAGRVKAVRLRTLREGELRGARPSFIERAFASDFAAVYPGTSKREAVSIAIRGGYPEAMELGVGERTEWIQDYLDALLSRDLRDIMNIRRSGDLRKLVGAVAAWSSKYVDTTKLGASIGIVHKTLMSYLGLLEKIYLCDRVAAWTRTDYERVSTKDKFYMGDTGLMAAVLNWRMDEVMLDSDRGGKLVETLVYQELAAQAELKTGYVISHYRDRAQREIDFLVENPAGEILGVEVKAGMNVGRDDFKHLEWFRDNLAAGRTFKGIVIYTGEHTLPFGRNMLAVPISVFWS